jgi:hypothetical protein
MPINQFTGESLPLSELRHSMLSEVYDYWRLKKGDREFPSRKDIAPEDMKAYLGKLMLIDVSYRPLDFFYRVFGSEIARSHGKDYTRQSICQIQPSEFGKLVWEQYLDAVNGRKPCLHRVTLDVGGKFEKYHRVTLPLSSDGVVIDKLLAVSLQDKKFWQNVRDTKGGSAERTGTSG